MNLYLKFFISVFFTCNVISSWGVVRPYFQAKKFEYYLKTTSDTTFKDITGEYMVEIPNSPFISDEFKVAIIPLDSIGKKNIEWHHYIETAKPGELLAGAFVSEAEFENEMLNCNQRKDDIYTRTIKRNKYCEKIGAGSNSMGGEVSATHYYSFIKVKVLIIIENTIVSRACPHIYLESEDKEELTECEKKETEYATKIDAFIDKTIQRLRFYKIKIAYLL